jgi:hypothetical protein
MLIKNVAFFTVYFIRVAIDGDRDALMRPRTEEPASTLEMETFSYIQAYLLDKSVQANYSDDKGNSIIHSLVI